MGQPESVGSIILSTVLVLIRVQRTMSQVVVITDLRDQRSVEWLRGRCPDNTEAENVKAPLVN